MAANSATLEVLRIGHENNPYKELSPQFVADVIARTDETRAKLTDAIVLIERLEEYVDELRGAGRYLVKQVEMGELTDSFDHPFVNNQAFSQFKELLEKQ